MATAADAQVVYEQEGVFIHTTVDQAEGQDSLVSGSLRVIEADGDSVVEYKPSDDVAEPFNVLSAGQDSSSVVEWGGGSGPPRLLESQLSGETEWDMLNAVYFRKKPSTPAEEPVAGAARGVQRTFSVSVKEVVSVRVKQDGWACLQLSTRDGALLPALHFHLGGAEAFLARLGRHVMLTESAFDKSCLLVSQPSKELSLSQSLDNLLDDATFSLVQKFRNDPYTTTLGGLSRVTHYLYDAFRGPEAGAPQEARSAQEVAELMNDVIPGLGVNQQEEPGFEVITTVDLGVRPAVQRRDPVWPEEWAEHVDTDGRVGNVPQLKRNIFKGGLCHKARKEAWKFLLGYFPWDSTYEERRTLQREKTEEYFRMKLQWKSVSEAQEKRNSRLRDHRSLIEKDVNRTDRTNAFYEGQDEPGLLLLHDVLMTYCMYDFDLGYVQGMSDLLSPILYIMENEVDAFWCFASFMDQMHQNFEEQMQGMKTQLIQLSTLLRLLDLAFWNYLESQESGYLYFCFRWLLIRFKRELSFQDVFRLWEVMWTGLPCQNFHLLLCCAILDSEKQKIMEEHYGFSQILKHINELSMKLNLEEILRKAEAICLQLRCCKDLPSSVAEILGFAAAPEGLPAEQPAQQPAPSGDLEADPTPPASQHLQHAPPDLYKLAYIS